MIYDKYSFGSVFRINAFSAKVQTRFDELLLSHHKIEQTTKSVNKLKRPGGPPSDSGKFTPAHTLLL